MRGVSVVIRGLLPKPKGSSPAKVMTEEDRLRREVEKLRAENAYIKNTGLEKPATRLKPEGWKQAINQLAVSYPNRFADNL